jgi:hypothetical protein
MVRFPSFCQTLIKEEWFREIFENSPNICLKIFYFGESDIEMDGPYKCYNWLSDFLKQHQKRWISTEDLRNVWPSERQ